MADLTAFAIGVAIGLAIRFAWARRRVARDPGDNVVEPWSPAFSGHCERHSRGLGGSAIVNGPGAYVALPDGRSIPVRLTADA